MQECIVGPASDGVEHDEPAWTPAVLGQGKFQCFMMCVEDQVEAIVRNGFAAGIGVGYGLAIDENPQALGQPSVPRLLVRLFASVTEPGDVLQSAP